MLKLNEIRLKSLISKTTETQEIFLLNKKEKACLWGNINYLGINLKYQPRVVT